MGQILSQTISDDDDHLQIHCIDITQHHYQPVSCPSSSFYENFDNNLDPSTSHTVVDLASVYEEDATTNENKKEPTIYHGNQVIPEVAWEDKVTPTISHVSGVRRIGQFTNDQRILLVGEGDFSFSASLAIAFGTSAVNITATSLNSKKFLTKNYGKFITNKAELESRGSTVLHGVDATTMSKHPVLGTMVFNRIVFNFPHAGKFGRSDAELIAHQKLIRGFLKNAKKMIGEDGEIHITSKSNGFFLEWDIPKIGSDHGLNLIQEMKFKRSKYPGYNTKFGFGGDKDFDCNPSKTYKFCLSLSR